LSSDHIAFAVVCWACALLFGAIALWAFKRRTPMHFWAGSAVKPQEITDIPAYNRANGLLWVAYGVLMAAIGVIALFEITVATVLLLIQCLPGVAVLIAVYRRIYQKYRRAD